MRIPISNHAVIDLEAPTLAAYEVYNGYVRWVVYCRHCHMWHSHSPQEGHREAHCHDPGSPYRRRGYNIALRGAWANYYFGRSPEDL